MQATERSRLDDYPADYPWQNRPIRCCTSNIQVGMLLVDRDGIPQFLRARCKGGGCKVEGLLTFHLYDLIEGTSFTFTHSYRTTTRV